MELLETAKSGGHAYSPVSLDAQMPDVDGFHVAARIQQDPGLAKALVVMLTSAGSTADAARCRELNISLPGEASETSRFAGCDQTRRSGAS